MIFVDVDEAQRLSKLIDRATAGEEVVVVDGVAHGLHRGIRRLRPRESPSKIRSVSSPDFMPLLGWDHVELWVGNAKEAAYFYEHAFGFTTTAYAGPETGVRDRASYVLEQGDIRFVLMSPLREDHEISRHVCRHGDGVKAVALAVPDAAEAYRQAVQRGARGAVEPHWPEDEHGRIENPAIRPHRDPRHPIPNR